MLWDLDPVGGVIGVAANLLQVQLAHGSLEEEVDEVEAFLVGQQFHQCNGHLHHPAILDVLDTPRHTLRVYTVKQTMCVWGGGG